MNKHWTVRLDKAMGVSTVEGFFFCKEKQGKKINSTSKGFVSLSLSSEGRKEGRKDRSNLLSIYLKIALTFVLYSRGWRV